MDRFLHKATPSREFNEGLVGADFEFRGDIERNKDEPGRKEARVPSAAEETALNAIQPRSDNAEYNSVSQTLTCFCLPNTRVTLLEEISEWAVNPNNRPMFWLIGMAGTGKTTRTVAKDLDEKGLLGASFFFSRDEEDRRSTVRLFPTIAYQLARTKPSLRSQINAAANPDVCNAMMRTQLEKLLINPLKAISDSKSLPIIIVLDALDECASEDQVVEMIVLLSSALQDLRLHLDTKVIVTGRPEIHIQGQFSKPGMQIVSSIFYLHNIEKSIVANDVPQYFNHHLTEIKNEKLSSDIEWPQKDNVEMLVDMADGLFIFASVAVSYIRRQPAERMEILLAGAGHMKASYAYKHLDGLYRQVLNSFTLDDDDDDPREVRERLSTLLGTIVVVLDPLSIQGLELLLNLRRA